LIDLFLLIDERTDGFNGKWKIPIKHL